LRKLNADTFIALNSRPQLVLAAWLAKIPTRIGPAERWHGLFQTHTVKVNRLLCDRNEVEYNFDLVKPLGVTRFAEKIDFPINSVDEALAKDFLKEKGIVPGTPYVVVHPGSRRSVLNWKPEKYAQMMSHLCQIKGLRVVITGAPDEAVLVSQVTAFLFSLPPERKPVVITGELGLKPLAAVYAGAVCFLSGSTGLMHLAAAVGTPTISLFSPAPEETPVRWGPWGNEAVVLIPDNPNCTSCQVGYCKKHDPMDILALSQVLQAMEKYIRKAIPQ
ncbi:MAG TPA: glycosyltransferase family 9 protein, partial [bacterium]